MGRRELAYRRKDIPKEEKKTKLFFNRFKGRIIAGAVGLTLIGTAGCSGCSKPMKEYMQKIDGQKKPELSPGEQEKINEQLMEAITGGDANEVKNLVEKGADVNTKNEIGRTTLDIACDRKQAEIVGILLENGADVNCRDDLNATPLILASVHKENIKVLEVLLDNGADIDARDDFGRTALIYAAGFGDTEMVKFLLDKGANSDIAGQGLLVENKQTALELAIHLERTENIEVLKTHEEN